MQETAKPKAWKAILHTRSQPGNRRGPCAAETKFFQGIEMTEEAMPWKVVPDATEPLRGASLV